MTPSGVGRGGGAGEHEFPPLLFSDATAPETSGHFRTPYSRTAATPMRGGAADSAQRSLSTRRSATPGSAMSADAAPTPPPTGRLGGMTPAAGAGRREPLPQQRPLRPPRPPTAAPAVWAPPAARPDGGAGGCALHAPDPRPPGR